MLITLDNTTDIVSAGLSKFIIAIIIVAIGSPCCSIVKLIAIILNYIKIVSIAPLYWPPVPIILCYDDMHNY